jgi:cytosine permease
MLIYNRLHFDSWQDCSQGGDMDTLVETPRTRGDGSIEFETTEVPLADRRSLRSVSAMWYGFPLNFVPAVFGGVLCAAMGFTGALAAIVLGSLALFAYVGVIGYLSGRTGKNFALQARHAFGRVGYLLIAGSLATVVVGWFAFNSGFIGATLNQTFGWNEWVMTLSASVVFVLITMIGARGLSILGMIAAPIFLISAVAAFVVVLPGVSLTALWAYPGEVGAGTLTLAAGITMVFAMFVDSGTMGADFTRWSKSGREAVLATATAFPVGNAVAFGSGAILVASGAVENAAVVGGNIITTLAVGNGPIAALLAVTCALVSIASVNAHCLYNGALSWGNMVNMRMRTLCVILGALATIVALTGVWHHLADWLSLLGIFVPPIGGVLIVAGLRALKEAQTRMGEEPAVNLPALAAYAVGAALAALVHFTAPSVPGPIVGVLSAALVYFLITMGTGAADRSRAAQADGR